jgi:hypothetical protein
MSFRQVYYTSCRSGLRGSPGFQINAATAGIPDSTLQQVERLCVYVPPVSAPSRPAQDELAAFPLSLIYQRLPEGEAVVAQARYIGADYTGRFGNYFAHSLLTTTPEQDLGTLLPIELWRAPVWRVSESETTTLPEADKPAPGDVISLPSVVRFLAEKDRGSRLETLFTAAVNALLTRRRIVIVDASDAVAHLIAAICYALPRHLALQLTFNTYAKSPYQTDALVVGTTSDSDFGFAQHEIDHMVYLFDFIGDRFTQVDDLSPWSRAIAALYREGAATHLAELSAFVTAVAPDLELADLQVAFATFTQLVGLKGSAVPPQRPQVASFCAARFARLPVERIGALLQELLSGELSEAIESALLLLRAARGAAVPRELRTEALRVLIGWAVEVASLQARVEDLARVVQEIAQAVDCRLAALPHRSRWIAIRSEIKDPIRLLLHLLLGVPLGYLEDQGSALEQIGLNDIGPVLHEARIQQLVIDLAFSEHALPLLHGIAQHLLPRVEDSQLFSKLGPLLGNGNVSRLLQDWALSRHALLFLFRVYGGRPKGAEGGRVAAFKDCVAAAQTETGTVSSEHANYAMEFVFGGAQPTVQEAIDVVPTLNPTVLAQSRIPSSLVKCLGHSGAEPIGKAREELAALLRPESMRVAMGKDAILLDLLRAAQRLEAQDWATQLPSVLECVEKAGIERGKGVCRMAAARVATVNELERHLSLLSSAQKACSWFGDEYLLAMEGPLQAKPGKPAAAVVSLLKGWLALKDAGGSPALNLGRIDQLLSRVVSAWGLRDLLQARAALGEDPEARKRLRAIVSADNPWSGRFRMMRATLLGVSALLLVLFIGHLLVRMFPSLVQESPTAPQSPGAAKLGHPSPSGQAAPAGMVGVRERR